MLYYKRKIPGNMLYYHLLTTKTDGRTLFGVQIMKKGSRPEVAAVYDVFPSREQTLKILALLAKHRVTPMTMKDVLYDLLP